MFTNFRYPLVAFFVSLILTLAGAVLKAFNIAGGSFLTGSMMMAQAIAIVWMVVLLVRKRG